MSQQRNLQSLSVLVFVNFAVAGVGFITQVKIANILGKEAFGLIAYGVAIAAYGGAIIRFGMDRTLVRDLTHFPDRFTTMVKASLVLRYALFGVVAIAVLAFKSTLPAGSDLTWGVVLVIIANAAMSLDLQGVFDSWHRMTRHALYHLFQRGLYFLLVWLIITQRPQYLTVSSVGAAMLAAVVSYLCLQYVWVLRRLPESRSSEKLTVLAAKMLRQNVVVWLGAVGYLAFASLNQVMLKHYHGSRELGGFAAAWMLVSLANILLGQVARIGNPATARITRSGTTRSQRIKFLVKYCTVMLAVAAPVALPALIMPERILGSIFRPEYASAAPVLRILGVYVVLFSVGLVASQYVIAARMETTYAYSVFTGGAVSVLMCVTVVKSAGDIGAAWSVLAAHGLSMVLYLAAMVRHVRNCR